MISRRSNFQNSSMRSFFVCLLACSSALRVRPESSLHLQQKHHQSLNENQLKALQEIDAMVDEMADMISGAKTGGPRLPTKQQLEDLSDKIADLTDCGTTTPDSPDADVCGGLSITYQAALAGKLADAFEHLPVDYVNLKYVAMRVADCIASATSGKGSDSVSAE